MNSQEIIKEIKKHFSDKQLEVSEQEGVLTITIDPASIQDACLYLKKDLHYDYLQFLTCIDRLDKIELQYHLYSYSHKGSIIIKTNLERIAGEIGSVSAIWKAANWHEREAYDLFGVIFTGHPGLRRILLEDDFKGNPLLKDFENPNMVKLPKV